jgi:hypothetical protein
MVASDWASNSERSRSPRLHKWSLKPLPALVAAAGFTVQMVEPHGYVQTTSPDFLLTLLSRGTSAGARAGEIGPGLVEGFVQEARRRVANRSFYGAILFLCLAARKDGE